MVSKFIELDNKGDLDCKTIGMTKEELLAAVEELKYFEAMKQD